MLYSFFYFFFKKQLNAEIQSANRIAINDYKKQQEQSKIITLKATYSEEDIFITISNEWNRLCLVKVVDFDKNIPIVIDLYTGKTFLCFSILKPFNSEVLKIVKTLNPYERYSLISKFDSILDKPILIDKSDPEHFDNELSFEELIELYQKNSQQYN